MALGTLHQRSTTVLSFVRLPHGLCHTFHALPGATCSFSSGSQSSSHPGEEENGLQRRRGQEVLGTALRDHPAALTKAVFPTVPRRVRTEAV